MSKQFDLYYSTHCPYCAKVLSALKSLDVDVNLIETNTAEVILALKEGGGKKQVPCLKITKDGQSKWMYESNDIIAFLKQQ